MIKTLFKSICIVLLVFFLTENALSQETRQATLNENGKITLEAVSLQIYKYSVDITALNLDTVEEVNTHFSSINASDYFRVEVVSITEINLILVRNNLYRNAFWDVTEWNQLLETL